MPDMRFKLSEGAVTKNVCRVRWLISGNHVVLRRRGLLWHGMRSL
jgi:hypothetical protein